ncbi:uncharacterized protein LOC134836685 isoform X1 [Culicoides brevitarsis]|uniref:uncharacterized protein LOC134836685 isoform X1 n=1 Tax=Culicoides brevitarsis TaxID=469753 RepID=UPI00307C4DE5
MKLLLASALCFLFAISFATPFVAAASQEIDVDDLINKLQQWRQNYNEEKEIVDGLHRKGPGSNPELNGKTHPVYLSKRMDPSERNLLLYSYFANRLGPSFEKRYNKQFEDLYEMEKRNFDEIDGSAFSPFKRAGIRH